MRRFQETITPLTAVAADRCRGLLLGRCQRAPDFGVSSIPPRPFAGDYAALFDICARPVPTTRGRQKYAARISAADQLVATLIKRVTCHKYSDKLQLLNVRDCRGTSTGCVTAFADS